MAQALRSYLRVAPPSASAIRTRRSSYVSASVASASSPALSPSSSIARAPTPTLLSAPSPSNRLVPHPLHAQRASVASKATAQMSAPTANPLLEVRKRGRRGRGVFFFRSRSLDCHTARLAPHRFISATLNHHVLQLSFSFSQPDSTLSLNHPNKQTGRPAPSLRPHRGRTRRPRNPHPAVGDRRLARRSRESRRRDRCFQRRLGLARLARGRRAARAPDRPPGTRLGQRHAPEGRQGLARAARRRRGGAAGARRVLAQAVAVEAALRRARGPEGRREGVLAAVGRAPQGRRRRAPRLHARRRRARGRPEGEVQRGAAGAVQVVDAVLEQRARRDQGVQEAGRRPQGRRGPAAVGAGAGVAAGGRAAGARGRDSREGALAADARRAFLLLLSFSFFSTPFSFQKKNVTFFSKTSTKNLDLDFQKKKNRSPPTCPCSSTPRTAD